MSTLKVNTLTDTAATKSVPIADVVNGTARAWVNFDGTGTVAIRAQYNVASITDNGAGNYTINFSTAFPDANYACVQGGFTTSTSYGFFDNFINQSTTSVNFIMTNNSGGGTDGANLGVSIFR